MRQPADLRYAVEEALAQQGPALLDDIVDPIVPPLPPRIQARQVYRYAWALFREKFPGPTRKRGPRRPERSL